MTSAKNFLLTTDEKKKAVRGKKDEEFETGDFKFQILISKLLDHLDRKIEIIANHKFLDTLKQIMLFVIVVVTNDMHRKVDTSVKNMSGSVTTKWSKVKLCQKLKQASNICNQHSMNECELLRSKPFEV